LPRPRYHCFYTFAYTAFASVKLWGKILHFLRYRLALIKSLLGLFLERRGLSVQAHIVRILQNCHLGLLARKAAETSSWRKTESFLGSDGTA
jgi:hypothetical protein